MIAVQEMMIRMYWLGIEYQDNSTFQGKMYSDVMSGIGIGFCKG